MRRYVYVAGLFTAGLVLGVFAATAPEQINYQAKVESKGVPFDGVGKFKFAIVDQGGTNTYWSNDGTSTGGGEPMSAAALNVNGGLLNVMLGDASHANMTPIPASTFERPDTWLRMWFGGTVGATFEKLAPDSKLASVPYAMMAQNVPDDSITGKKLMRESVWPVHAGRDNTIVSYYAEYTGDNVVTITNIPGDKNYIITDVVFGGVSGPAAGADIVVSYVKNGTATILFKQISSYSIFTSGSPYGAATYVPPCRIHFKSGLVVPAGSQLKVGGFSGAFGTTKSCSIAGFEIPVE